MNLWGLAFALLGIGCAGFTLGAALAWARDWVRG